MLIAMFLSGVLFYVIGSIGESREKAKRRADNRRVYDDFCRRYPNHAYLMDHFLDEDD
jgi:hypothetical protein